MPEPVVFNADQMKAKEMFDEFMQNPDINEMGLVGPPGRGKSWLINQFILGLHTENRIMNHLLDESNNVNLALTATSNESANLISETCGISATTIHSLLGLRVMDNYTNGDTYLVKTKNYKYRYGMLVIIDEAGWVNEELLDIIRTTLYDCKILYVYDHKQLTSVNKKNGKVSTCAVHTQVNYTAYLGINERNNNPIGIIGDRFRDSVGEPYFPHLEEFPGWVEWIDDDEFNRLIQNHFVENQHSAKILAWTNNMVNSYNEYVRDDIYEFVEFMPGETVVTNKPILHPDGSTVLYATDSRITVAKVLEQTSRMGIEGYEFCDVQGNIIFVPYDIGLVNNLIKQAAKEKDWVTYFGLKNGINDLRPMYASTVHKVQGKTNDITIVDLDNIGRNPNAEEVKRLLGVAFSRPRKKLYLYGHLPRKYGGTDNAP